MELLAPVGTEEALKAAIAGGADAVYLGGKSFGARHFASNFSDELLAGAIKLTHDRGMRTYVTVNTLIKEGEMADALSFVGMLDDAGADAVIVQDRGLLPLIKERFSIPVHASTQMAVHTSAGVSWAQKQGIERVILARELGLEQVKEIAESSNIGIEVFIHGALCYCFSGQCLFSSFLGGRSGNRGMCAQPCRKSYTLGKKEGYLLSTADTFGIGSIPELMRCGVTSLKIEGRMRSPQYVYLTSKIYKKAIERAKNGETPLITDREREMLEVVFNRGFSGGYLTDQEVMQTAHPESRGRPLGPAQVEKGRLRMPRGALGAGDGISLYQGNEKVGGFDLKGSDLDGTNVIASPPFLLKDGDYTVYKTKDRELPVIEDLISKIRLQEREAVRKTVELPPKRMRRGETVSELSFYVSSLAVLRSVLPYADRVYFDGAKVDAEAEEICASEGKEFVKMLPRLSLKESASDHDRVMVNTIDQYELNKGRTVYGSYHMNFFNSYTLPKLHQCTLSPELNQEELIHVLSRTEGRCEVMAFGRLELMLSRDPTLPEGTLVDDRGVRYPVHRDPEGFVHILHSTDLLMLDKVPELRTMGVDSLGIDVRRRHPDLAAFVGKSFKELDMANLEELRRKCGRSSLGHYRKGVF
ncbi:MAG TPA: U32 family peptidase [Methanomassiliicoccales archaeon]|nr:U32 family peptidase [Methanomassiliicoccales archaeon]